MIVKRSDVMVLELPKVIQAKILLVSLFLIPVAVIVHLFTMLVSVLNIPNSVIDIVTFGEKAKLHYIKQKENLQNDISQ